MTSRAAFATALAGALAGAAACGCAKKLPPTGGPPDVVPPLVAATTPDSGAVGVPLDSPIRVVFSERMDRVSAAGLVLVGPGVRIRRERWEEGGRTFALEPESPLAPDRTYTLLVGAAARDLRGNPLVAGVTSIFTTGAAFSPGRIGGRVEGRGVRPEGVYLWAYRDDLGRRPDSTSLDMDGLGRSGAGGAFELLGLATPGRYRLYAFVDRNQNRTFEPGVDLLTASDSLVSLAAASPRADSVRVLAVDPEALGRVEIAVLDSLVPDPADTARAINVRLEARLLEAPIAEERALRLAPRPVAVAAGQARLELPAGRWSLTAFRDLDGDGERDPGEPASEPITIEIGPGETRTGLEIRLPGPAGSPGAPR